MYLCIFHLTHEDFMFRIFEPQCWDILFLCVASGVFLYSALCVMFQTMTMLWNAWDAICLTPRRKDRRLFLQMGNCKCKWSSQLIWKTLISSREIQFWRVAIPRLSKQGVILHNTREWRFVWCSLENHVLWKKYSIVILSSAPPRFEFEIELFINSALQLSSSSSQRKVWRYLPAQAFIAMEQNKRRHYTLRIYFYEHASNATCSVEEDICGKLG